MTYQPAGLNRCLIACYKHFVKLAFCAGFVGNAGQEGYGLAQVAHAGSWPGIYGQVLPQFGSFCILLLSPVFHRSF